LLLGAAFNRTDDYLLFYNSISSAKFYQYDSTMPELKGKSDYLLGLRTGKMNFGASYYSASQHKIAGSVDTVEVEVNLRKISAGTEIGLGDHSLEVYASLGQLAYAVSTLIRSDSALNIGATTDQSIWVGSRLFYKTAIGGGLVFVPALEYQSLSGFDSTFSKIGVGMGLNLRLDGGFFWAGVEGESYSAEKNDSTDFSLSGLGVRFNFGIEKSLIWKWFTVRVGGSKFVAKETFTKGNGKEESRWFENSTDDGSSDDFLGFGVGLNYQNRLRFDITLNEALPYFNPFGDGLKNSSNGGHMLLRISSTFSL
jgi:hypothetical protein